MSNRFTAVFRNKEKRLFLFSTLLLLIPLAGQLSPDYWWGSHSLAFLPAYMSAICWGMAIGLLVVAGFRSKERPFAKTPSRSVFLVLSLLAGAAMGALCFAFPIAYDLYGDAVLYFPLLEIQTETLDPEIYDRIFSFEFRSGQGRRTLLRIMTLFSYHTGLTYKELYQITTAICGGLYVFSWLQFSRSYLRMAWPRMLGIILAIGTPMIQVFFGHVESYALVFLLLSWWGMLLFIYVEKGNPAVGTLWVINWVVGVRFHIFFLLLLPVLVMVFAYQFRHRFENLSRFWSVKGVIYRIFLPMCGMALAFYFGVLEDHKDPRTLDDIENIQRLFLPIIPPDPPLDRYTLISSWHLFDFLQMVFLWSLPAWLFLLTSTTGWWKKINSRRPELFFGVFALGIIVAMLFMTNPLLSMPLDWDLFCIAVPLLVLVCFAIIRSLQEEEAEIPWQRLSIAALALSLFVVPVITVNTLEEPQSLRHEAVGKYVFKSYYLHSSRAILFAVNFPSQPHDEHQAREERIIAELEPYALPDNDPRYKELLLNCAMLAYKVNGQSEKGLELYLKAEKYGPIRPEDAASIMNIHLELQQYPEAQARAELLLTVNYPSRQQALLQVMRTYMEARDYQSVLPHARTFFEENPKAGKMGDLIRSIEENDHPEVYLELFR